MAAQLTGMRRSASRELLGEISLVFHPSLDRQGLETNFQAIGLSRYRIADALAVQAFAPIKIFIPCW